MCVCTTKTGAKQIVILQKHNVNMDMPTTLKANYFIWKNKLSKLVKEMPSEACIESIC